MYNKLLFFIILAFSGLHVSAEDTLKIEIIRKNRIGTNNTKISEVTVAQKFYTNTGQLFREIIYDEVTGELDGYTFYFYRDGRLSGEEVYDSNDVFLFLVKYEYDKDGNNILWYQSSEPDDKVPAIKIVRNFSSSGLKLKEKVIRNGATASVTKYKYNAVEKLVLLTARYKPAADTTLKSSAEEYSYDGADRISSVSLINVAGNGERNVFTDYYSYNDNGQLILVSRKNDGGTVISEKNYTWYATGTLRDIRQNDGNGNTVEWFTIEYRTNVMNTGTQKSVVDGLVFP